jgi:hypothetical protein
MDEARADLAVAKYTKRAARSGSDAAPAGADDTDGDA